MEPESLVEIYKTAVLKKDIELYASIFDEEVYVFDTWQRWNYIGLAAWLEMTRAWFTSLGTDHDSVTFDDINIEKCGDIALITAIMKFTAISDEGEELRFLQNRLTWVAKKKEKGWKIIHQHTSSPVDFETMQVMLTR